MTSAKLEIILFLIGIGFGPTAPLTQVALQNTVSIHNLGAGLGTIDPRTADRSAFDAAVERACDNSIHTIAARLAEETCDLVDQFHFLCVHLNLRLVEALLDDDGQHLGNALQNHGVERAPFARFAALLDLEEAGENAARAQLNH